MTTSSFARRRRGSSMRSTASVRKSSGRSPRKRSALIEKQFMSHAGVVLFAENWHPGVVGIVAGRVTRKYNRPCVVLGNEGDMAKGSGRSVDGVNLVEVLGTCCEHLTSWGGHPMAVGVALPKLHLATFRARLRRRRARARRRRHCRGATRHRGVADAGANHGAADGGARYAASRSARETRSRFLACAASCCAHPPEVFKEQHFRFHFEDGRGRRLHGVAWKLAHRCPPLGVPIDLAVELKWNHFNNRKLLQVGLIDWRTSAPLRARLRFESLKMFEYAIHLRLA